MTYLQTNRRPAWRRSRIIALILILVALAFFGFKYFAPQFVPGIAISIAKPFWRTELSVQLGTLKSPQELLNENEELRRQLAAAQVRLTTISSVETINQQLLTILGRASTTPYTLAAVLMRPPLAAFDEFIIDIGQDHNLNIGDKVFAPGDVPIGEVSEVFSDTSKVTLYSTPGHSYEVLIGPAAIAASAAGRGGGQYEAEVPRSVRLTAGDFILAPSVNSKPFGIVQSVVSDPAQPFEKVLFAPPVNIYGLRWVLVENKIVAGSR